MKNWNKLLKQMSKETQLVAFWQMI